MILWFYQNIISFFNVGGKPQIDLCVLSDFWNPWRRIQSPNHATGAVMDGADLSYLS